MIHMSIIKDFCIPNFHLNSQERKNATPNKISSINSKNIEQSSEEVEINTNTDEVFSEVEYDNIKEEGFTPQGYTVIDGKTYISAYKHGENSKIYIYNNDTNSYEGSIILDEKVHAGGICCDKENGILFVTGKGGFVLTYDYNLLQDAINTTQKNIDIPYVIDLTNNDLKNCRIENDIQASRMASINYYNGSLYSTTFSATGEITKISYEYKDGKIIENNKSTVDLGTATQGMTFYNQNGQDYMILSSSSGVANSTLSIYEMNDDSYKLVGMKDFSQSGLEGIQCDNDGNIYGIFEFKEQKVQQISSVDEMNGSKDFSPLNIGLQYIGALYHDLKNK